MGELPTGPVKNKELIQEILGIQSTRRVTYYHVRGHTGNVYNEKADRAGSPWVLNFLFEILPL